MPCMCLAVKQKNMTRLRAWGRRPRGERTAERGTTRGRAVEKAATAAPMVASCSAPQGEERARSARRPKPESAGRKREAQRLRGKCTQRAHGINKARQPNAGMGPSKEAVVAGSKNASCA